MSIGTRKSKFFGHLVPAGGIEQLPQDQTIPSNPGNKKRGTGLINWTDYDREAFEKCKSDLVNYSLLAHPVHNAQFQLRVDASGFVIDGALEQIVEGEALNRSHLSRKNSHQRNKSMNIWPWTTLHVQVGKILAGYARSDFLHQIGPGTVATHIQSKTGKKLAHVTDFLSRIARITSEGEIDFEALVKKQKSEL